ncbi:MAG: endonuclease/exonuclease/phosphatase family protein [Paludibacteraceae bacterium]
MKKLMILGFATAVLAACTPDELPSVPDNNNKQDTTQTEQPDTTHTEQPDTIHTEQPDTIPVVEPPAEGYLVQVDTKSAGIVILFDNDKMVETPYRCAHGTVLTAVMIPDDEHFLTGSNIDKGRSARASFTVTCDTVIRPVFEYIVPVTPTATHKICNYNIRYYNGSGDGDNSGNRAWPVRRDKVFEMIRKHSMDVCGIEEITTNQSPDFINSLVEYEYIGYGRNNGKENSAGGSGEQTGIIYRKARYVKMDQGRFFLSKTPDVASKVSGASFNRMVTWVRLKERKSDTQFYFFATHFDHPTDQTGINTRSTEADIALKMVPAITGDMPMFFVGDFNCKPSEPAYAKLSGQWADAFVRMGSAAQGGYVCNAEQAADFATACAESGNTYTGLYSSSDPEPKRIDYVLYNADKATVSSYMADNDNLTLEMYPSDHLPVVTEMVVR